MIRLLLKASATASTSKPAYTEPWESCTCADGCQEHAHVTMVDGESGDSFKVRVPYQHRYDPVGWHGRERVRWTGDDGAELRGLETGRGADGVTLVDTGGRSHRVSHGRYQSRAAELLPMSKARAALKAGQRWITVHPNGSDEKGVPILISPNPDGTHSVVAGAGGKLSHLRLHGIKSPEEYAEHAKGKAQEKRAKDTARKASQAPEERQAEQASKAEVKEAKKQAERTFIESVRARMGGVREDLPEGSLSHLSEGGRNIIQSRHHRRQLGDAKERVREASAKLVDEHAQRLKLRGQLEQAMEDDPVVHGEAAHQAAMELDLRAAEDEERKRERVLNRERVTSGPSKVSEKAATATKDLIQRADDPSNELGRLGGRDDDPARPQVDVDIRPSEELHRRALQSMQTAQVLQKVADGGAPASDLEKRIVAKAIALTGSTETDPAALQQEAGRALRRSEVLTARSKSLESLEESSERGIERATRLLAATDVMSNIAHETQAAKKLGLTDADRVPLKEAEIEEFKDVLRDSATLREKTAQFKAMDKAAENGDYDKARSSFQVSTAEKLDEKVADDIEDEVRRAMAESVRGVADRKRTEFMQAHAAGAYDALADVGLGIGGNRYIDRATVDALGPANAAVLLRHALEGDGHYRARVLRALESHHVQTQTKIAQDAVAKAESYVPGLSTAVEAVGDIETALAQSDAHKRDIAEAQKAVGASLGRLETMALMGQAFRQQEPGHLVVHGKDMKATLAWLHSLGLTDSGKDYELDHEAKTATIPQSAWSKLIHREPKEAMARKNEALAIKAGEKDQEGWLPAGIVRREASTFTTASPVAPRLYQDLDLRGKPMRTAIEDHVGSRLADGEQPHDVLHDLLSPATMAQVDEPDRAAYTDHVKDLFPLTDAEGKRRKYEESAPHFENLASQWAAKHGVDGAFHAQDIQVEDPRTHEALFRTQADYPQAAVAFAPTGDLTHGQQASIRDHFYKRMGIDPKAKADEAKFKARLATLGPEPDPNKGTMSMFGGGGPSPEHREWSSARDALLKQYPRAGLTEALKAAKGDPEKESAARQAASEQKTAWERYVDTHGSLELAQRAIQDEMKHEALQKFSEHYGRLTRRPLKMGVAEVTNQERHQKATASEGEAAQMAADQQALQAKLRARTGGQFAAEGEGAVKDKFTRYLEQATIDKQNQLGMFGSAKEKGKELPQLPTPGKGERWSVGARAEAQIASLMPRIAEQFDAGKGVKLMAGLDMDKGDRIHQQRAVKMMRATKRMGGYLGPGSGKSLISIGSFTDLHHTGDTTHGLYLVPSAVQDQFGSEMLRFTEPGKYRWATGSGKGHAEREAMLRDPALHMKVMTHEGFTQTVAKMLADHHTGGDLDAMKAKLTAAKPAERASMLKEVREKHGIKPWFFYGDEAHKFTQRGEGKPSLVNMVMGAASHPDNATHALFGTGTPHKNDEGEVFSMASLIDPKKYADRHEFMQAYGTELGQRPDAIRRELAHATYSASVLPEGIERTDSDNPTIRDGRKVGGDGPIQLKGAHKAAVDAVRNNYETAQRAAKNGKVDVNAIKALSPGKFEGQPEDKHEEIARSLLPHLGIVRESAMRRAINRTPSPANQKLQQMGDVVEHDVKAGTWTDRNGQEHRGKPAVIFTDSAAEARQIHEHLAGRGLRSALYHGGLDAKKREAVRLGFQPPPGEEPKYDVVVATSSAEAGINMQRAKVIHHYDVPQTEKSHAQRSGRAFRQGQEGDVDIHNWHTDADYEQDARRRLRRKEGLASVFQSAIGNLDETGIAAEYHKALTHDHQSSLTEVA